MATVEQLKTLIAGIDREIDEIEVLIKSYTKMLNYLEKVPEPELKEGILFYRADLEVHRDHLLEQKKRLEKNLQELKLKLIKST